MKKIFGLFIIIMNISSCTNQHVTSDKVFSNAQILYHDKNENTSAQKSALEMPSYFIDLNYDSNQTQLSPMQIKKVEQIFKKLVYPEEYTLYASFGASATGKQIATLGTVFKRAQDIKAHYSKRVKKIKVVFLKNQKPNCVYLRLLS